MHEIKTWHLYVDPFTKNDYIWIRGLGCELAIKNPESISIDLPVHPTQYRYCPQQAPWVEVETTSEKQQSMLQLKYSQLLCLKEVRIDYDRIY